MAVKEEDDRIIGHLLRLCKRNKLILKPHSTDCVICPTILIRLNLIWLWVRGWVWVRIIYF